MQQLQPSAEIIARMNSTVTSDFEVESVYDANCVARSKRETLEMDTQIRGNLELSACFTNLLTEMAIRWCAYFSRAKNC